MKDEKLLEENGWSVECESPLEIRHTDGSFATMQAANTILTDLIVEDEPKFESNRHKIQISYELLINLLQGKECHFSSFDNSFVFIPPFDGVFLTHEELGNLKYSNQMEAFKLMDKLQVYEEKANKGRIL